MESTNETRFSVPNGHNPVGPRKLTIDGLAALSEKHIAVQNGPEVKYDEYGRPTNVKLVEDEAYTHTAKMQLRAIYHNFDASQDDRRKAGVALKYTDFRINLHEALLPLRKDVRRIREGLIDYVLCPIFRKNL